MVNSFNRYINFLKGIAVLCVFMLHFSLISPGQKPVFMYTPAWVGVWIFFIISGFLLGKGYWSGKYKTSTIKDFGKFYWNRITKILPIYFFIVFIDIFFVNTNIYFNGSETLLRVFTFRLRNPYADPMIGNLWFVSTLIQLYLITPFVWKFLIYPLRKVKMVFLVIAIITFYFLRSYFFERTSWDYFILPNILTNLDLYFCGFIFSAFCINGEDSRRKKVLRPISSIILICFIVANTIAMHSLLILDFPVAKFCKIDSVTITLLIILLNLYAFDVKDGYRKLELNKPLFIMKNPFIFFNYLGIISYSFYCCHCQIIVKVSEALNNNESSWITTFIFSFIFTLLWAIILYLIIEKPMAKLKFKE